MGKFSLADHIQSAQSPAPRDIETITAEILDAKRVGGEAILTIGKGLIEAKAMLPHGEWLPWLEDRVEFSERSARNLMRLARDWTNRQALADLGATKALQLLALPESERDEFLNEPHEVGGEQKNVIDMTSRELAIVIKERDEALKAAEQARAEQSAAEQARQKMEEDVAFANQRVADLQALADRYSAEAQELQKTSVWLSAELEELRSQPRDVAVEVDEAAVEAARKEAEAAMRAKLDKANEAKKQAEAQAKAAEDALEETRRKLAGAVAGRQDAEKALAEQAALAEKKAALASDADLILFGELLSQWQTIANRMHGVILKKQDKAPETAGKLRAAMRAALDTAGKLVQE